MRPDTRAVERAGVSHESEAARLALRAANLADEFFGFEVFAQSRLPGEDFANFDPALRDLLLKQQYAGQIAGYRHDYPAASVEIASYDGVSIGRRITDRGGNAWTLLDIALLPQWRGRGLGEALVRRSTAEAAAIGCPLDLMVATRNSGALRLYLRLGFVVTEATPTHLALRHSGISGDGP